jgi:ADP-heptose:LPS heptosyltransferase
MNGVRKIAVLRPGAVGDFVFALPALHALRQAYPEAHIVYVGKPWHAEFLAQRPGPIDECIVLPPCPGLGLPAEAQADATLARFLDAMREQQFDVALQMYGGGRYANPLLLQFGGRLTAGMKAENAMALDRWVSFRPMQNRRLQLLEVASLIGADMVWLERELVVTGRDRQLAREELPEGAAPLVVLQPGASDPRRRWPAQRFAELGDILADEGAQVAVNGTAEEAPIVRAVLERMRHRAVDLSGKLSLSGLCGLLERAALLVSNDTGPLHLGLAIGTPSVGIYWLTNLIESGPLRQHLHRPAMSTRIHCPVCGMENLKERCAHDVSFVDVVTVGEVAALAHDLLSCP